MRPPQITTALFLVCGCTAAFALPVGFSDSSDTSSIPSLSYRLEKREACIIEGNPDLYGLGIRLGVYTQLISSLLANYYHDEILQDAWDTVCHVCLHLDSFSYAQVEYDLSRRCICCHLAGDRRPGAPTG